MADRRKTKRRWFQISLRTLLVLFLLSGVLFGWMGHRLSYARRQRAAVEEITTLGGMVGYRVAWSTSAEEPWLKESWIPRWLVGLLGDDFFLNATGVRLGGGGIRNQHLVHLQPLTHLRHLTLSGSRITDEGMVHLQPFRRLESLELEGTRISDDGLAQLPHLPRLRHLDVCWTDVTEEGLLHLREAQQLEKLYIIEARVTPSGVRELEETFPDAKIYDRFWRTSAETYP